MCFDVWRLNQIRQIRRIFKLWYMSRPRRREEKKRSLTSLKLKLYYPPMVLCSSSWKSVLLVCPLRGTTASPRNRLINAVFITEHESFWIKCHEGAQNVSWQIGWETWKELKKKGGIYLCMYDIVYFIYIYIYICYCKWSNDKYQKKRKSVCNSNVRQLLFHCSTLHHLLKRSKWVRRWRAPIDPWFHWSPPPLFFSRQWQSEGMGAMVAMRRSLSE